MGPNSGPAGLVEWQKRVAFWLPGKLVILTSADASAHRNTGVQLLEDAASSISAKDFYGGKRMGPA